MGVDTEIIINAKWGSDDICKILNNHLEMDEPAKEQASHTPSYTLITFKEKGQDLRMMSYHREYNTPIGNAVLLTLSCHGRAQAIMQIIGNAIGGFYQPEDCSGNYELMRGLLSEGDGLPYFLKHAILEGAMKDNDNIKGLQKYIAEWEAKHNIGRSEIIMTHSEVDLAIFFTTFCRMIKNIPQCETCTNNVDGAGCQHPLHPANKEVAYK